MPDGDKFERKLRGKGWRKAYREACNPSSSHTLIADFLMTGLSHALNNEMACPVLTEIRDAVQQALVDQADLPNRLDLDRVDPFYALDIKLAEIQASQTGSISTHLAIKAAQNTFIDLEADCDSVAAQQVQDRFSEFWARKLIGYQWLDRVRDGIEANSGRSVAEQMTWEDELLTTTAEQFKKMLESHFRSKGQARLRAPRRLTPKRKMTIDELQRGLKVLEL
jgi:hypothetical protein